MVARKIFGCSCRVVQDQIKVLYKIFLKEKVHEYEEIKIIGNSFYADDFIKN